MVLAGAHPKLLQAQMGHSSIKVTLDLYGHLYPDIVGPVTQALDALISPDSARSELSGRKRSGKWGGRCDATHHKRPANQIRERRDSNPRPPA
jgi:hypothetical protein